VTIPPGAQVIICLAAANRVPARYAKADGLDIDWVETRHLAFRHGIHHCLGAPLVRMEGPARPHVVAGVSRKLKVCSWG
jgi:cytochrome P450